MNWMLERGTNATPTPGVPVSTGGSGAAETALSVGFMIQDAAYGLPSALGAGAIDMGSLDVWSVDNVAAAVLAKRRQRLRELGWNFRSKVFSGVTDWLDAAGKSTVQRDLAMGAIKRCSWRGAQTGTAPGESAYRSGSPCLGAGIRGVRFTRRR